MSEIGILVVFLEAAGNEDVAAFHVEVILRASERIIVTRFPDDAGGRRCGPERARSTHGVGVEAFVRACIAGLLAAVA